MRELELIVQQVRFWVKDKRALRKRLGPFERKTMCWELLRF